MKQIWNILKKYGVWLGLLLYIDVFAAFLLWISDARAFRPLLGMILLWSAGLFTAVFLVAGICERKKQQRFEAYLMCPDELNEEKLLRLLCAQEREELRRLSGVLREKQADLQKQAEQLRDYEEYVEGWVHEAKTPLSLLTMLLDNRGDEMPAHVREKLDYVRSQLQEDINQMLYYARLKSSTKDYLFETVVVQEVLEEVLEDYGPLLEEKGFAIESRLGAQCVYTDRRGLRFMLGQVISNAIRYSGASPVLCISLEQGPRQDVLVIADNGMGVKSCDLPYLFQKGFTGESTDRRKKATGMGLYLTKKMADDLNLTVDAVSQWGNGFSFTITFPRVEEP